MDEPDRAEPPDGGPPPLTRNVPLLWALVALALALLTAAAALLLLRDARGPRPPFMSDPAARASVPSSSAAPLAAPPGGLALAGSGSNLPLTRALVDAFLQAEPAAAIAVHESIGSTGGVRAVRDGATDVGLVSRPLTDEEARFGLVVTPYARVAVVVAAHPKVPETCTSREGFVRWVSGAASRWSDGSRVVVLQREHGDSSLSAFARLTPGLLAETDAATRQNRWRVLYSDLAMQEALMATEGSVGLFDQGAIEAQHLPLAILCVDGVLPSPETVRSGRYPFWKDLAFVTAGGASRLRDELLRFALSGAGRALTARLGYLPLPLDPGLDGGAPP